MQNYGTNSPRESLKPGDGKSRALRHRLDIKGELALAVLPTVTVLAVLGLVETFSNQRLLFASLASSAFLIYLDPQHGTNSVRTLVLSQFAAAIVGWLAFALFTKDESDDLHHKLEALGFGFFIPIFFVMVGARFDVSALTNSPQGMMLAPLLIVGALAIKVLSSLPFRALMSWREALASGFLMSSRLSLIIAAAEIGQRLGLFPEAVLRRADRRRVSDGDCRAAGFSTPPAAPYGAARQASTS